MAETPDGQDTSGRTGTRRTTGIIESGNGSADDRAPAPTGPERPGGTASSQEAGGPAPAQGPGGPDGPDEPAPAHAQGPDSPDSPNGGTMPAGGATPDGEPGTSGDDEAPAPARRPVHRLRDLDRAGKAWAALFAVGLLLAPVLAFAWAAPDWVPANDPAFMGLRALDVGTSRTPLTGQPSTSAHYVGGDRHVDHPGPIHFYLMAPFVRALGVSLGMLFTSLLIVSTSVLVAAWAVFRQLGRHAATVAAVALGAVTFTTGAATLVNPVSSNIAGYPLLCSMVLLWCLLCGDVRLLPLAAAAVSFTAQQHLSVLPALLLAVVLTVGTAGLAWWRGRRREPGAARELGRWTLGAGVVSLVLWSPVLLQQATGSPGNISMMATFAADSDRETVGPAFALRQVANALGLPPVLFSTDLDGGRLLRPPSALTWASAGAVVVALGVLAWHWRRDHPRRVALVAGAAFVAAGGMVNGSSVPDSLEQFRLPFYHWVFPLQVLVLVALGLAVADAARAVVPASRRPLARRGLAVASLVALAGPALVNPGLDRRSNTLLAAYSPVERDVVTELASEVRAHRDRMGDHVLLLSRGGRSYEGIGEALAVVLAEQGLDLRFPTNNTHYVHDDRLASPDALDGALLVVMEHAAFDDEVPGEVIAEASVVEGLDTEAYDELVAAAEAQAATGEFPFGPGIEEEFPHLPPDLFGRIEEDLASIDLEALLLGLDEPGIREFGALGNALGIRQEPRTALMDVGVLTTLVEHPATAPYLDPELARRLRDSLPERWDGDRPLRIRAYLLDREEALALAAPSEL